MSQLEQAGTYIGEIVESAVSTTQKGYPQWIIRLAIEKGYIDDPERMKHFALTEPGYVDWSSYGDTLTGYFVLFNSADSFDESTKLFWYEDIQKAVGWDGSEFESLLTLPLGKKILVRVEESTYNEKTSLKIKSIDVESADPIRGLKSLDVAEVKALGKIKIAGKKPAAVPAKAPPAKPTGVDFSKHTAASKAATPSPAAVTPPATKPVTTASPSKGPPKAAAKPVAEAPASDVLPAEVTQLQAWEYLESKKGDTALKDLEETWISISAEIGGTRKEEELTGADWAKIRDLVAKDLAL